MKKLLFVVALLSVGTTLVNAMTSVPGEQTDTERNLAMLRKAREQHMDRRNLTGADEDEMTGQENDAVTGEEQDVTQCEENSY